MDILCQNFQVEHSYPFFRSRNLISQEDQDDIKSEKTSSKRTLCFLNILLKKDIEFAFNSLIEYIKECRNQQFLIDFINQKLKEHTF